MDDAEQDPTLAQLTAEMAWLRRLARALIRSDEAGDLAQDTWLVAAERAPADRPLRPWLARVALNLARMRGRARQRREARELASGSLAEPVPDPDELVQRVELQRLVAGEVLRLAEPYRSTVLLHYVEELTCAEIARRLRLPEGTVRRRLKTALDELRARLDHRRDGRGLAALAPLAGITRSKPAASLAVGVLAMKKLVLAIAILLVLLLAWLWHGRDRTRTDERATTAERASLPAAGLPGARATPPVEAMWLAQRDVRPRRVAGRVTFRGAPVAGATVELASLASESGLVAAPRRTTNAAGEFDFGPQPAMELSVRASATGRTSAAVEIDLRAPAANPPPDRLEVQLGACTAALFGTVRDASGGAIAKARVARLEQGRSGIPGGAAAVTDDKGAYEMCVEESWPGWVSVEVSAHGYGAIVFTTIIPGRVKVDFALVPEATIVGRVIRDDNGKPVPQAYVVLPAGPRAVESTASHATFTDATGHFRLDGVAPGRHQLFARADGMAASSRGTPVLVQAGQTTAEIEIRLEAGATLRGTVVDHGKPVAGARVAPAAIDGGRATTTAISQEDGTFVLAEVPRGTIRFTALPYDVVSPATFQVSQPEHDGVVIEVEALGTIVGHAIRAKKPVPGASIDIRGPNDRDLAPIHADAEGRFEARGLRPGPWTLFASNEREGAFGGPQTVQLGRGQTTEVTIDIAYAAAIAGRVVDQRGDPVPGVTVTFRNTNTDDGGIAVTAVDGTFRAATMMGGGQYRPAVRLNALASTALRPAAGSEFPLVTLDGRDAEVTGVVLAVQLDRQSIAGKVIDTNGAPVPDARVIAGLAGLGDDLSSFGGIQDPATTTDADGRFAIGDLVSGTYALHARAPAGGDVTLAGVRAGRTDVTLVLPVAGAIEGTLVGFHDTPQVTATRTDAQTPRAPVIGIVQTSGFTLRELSPGSYLVTARTTSEAASALVEVAPGRTAHATLTSGGSGVVTGHVRQFSSGKPVEGMTCRALPRVGIAATYTFPGDGVRTDAQGAFAITTAPAGDIVVSCDGLWRLYSDGVRPITLQSAQPADVEVMVVAWRDETSHTIAGFGADVDDQVLVPRFVRVQPGGAAAAAGFQNGDLVTTVDGASVAELSPRGVWILIANRTPGTKVKVGVTRAGKTITGELVLRELAPGPF